MTHARKLARDGGWMLAGQLLAMLISIGFTAYILRVMTKEDIAVIAMLVIIEGLITLLRGFGLATSSIRSVPNLWNKGKYTSAKKLITITWWLPLVATLVLGGVGIVESEFLSLWLLKSSEYSSLMVLVVIYGIAASALNQEFLLFQALQEFKYMSILTTGVQLGQRLISVLLWFKWGLEGYLVGYIVATASGSVIGYLKLLPLMRVKVGFKYLSKMLKESFPFYVTHFARYLFYQADQLLVAWLMDPIALAVYFVIRGIIRQLVSIWDTLFTPLTPKLSELKSPIRSKAMGDDLKVLFTLSFWLLSMAAAMVFIMAEFGLDIYTGGRYTDYTRLLATAGLLLIPYGLVTIVTSVVVVFKRPVVSFVNNLLVGAVSLMSLFIFVKIWGLFGAVWSQILTYSIALVWGWWLVRKEVKLTIDWKFGIKYSVVTVAVSSIFAGLVGMAAAGWQIVLLGSTAFLIMFVVGWFLMEKRVINWLKEELSVLLKIYSSKTV